MRSSGVHRQPGLLRASLIVAFLLCSSIRAGDAVSIGPFGGASWSVLVDPSDAQTWLVGTDTGLLRTTDGGATFAPYGTGITGFIFGLYADPTTATTFHALVGNQVFRSLDSGATWAALSLSASSTLRSLSIAGSTMLAHDIGELWQSTDGGATWGFVHSGVVLEQVLFAPSNPQVAYLGHLNGVHKSTDGGATWTQTTGFTTWCKAIAVDAATENTILCGGIGGAMDASYDGGVTSVSINNGYSTSSTQFVYFEPGSSTTFWGGALDGTWVTTDGGQNWTAANQGLGGASPIPNELAFSPAGDLLLATDNAFFHRGSFGAPPWVPIGFPSVSLIDAVFAAPGGDRLVTSLKGVYSAVPGAPLVPSGWFFDFGGHTDVILTDPASSDRWIFGGVGSFIDNAQIRTATRNGSDASIRYEQFGGGHIEALAMRPDNPAEMLAGQSPSGSGQGIVASADTGRNWSGVTGTGSWPVVSIAYDPHNTSHVIALLQDHRHAESTDGGATFTLNTTWTGSGLAGRFAFDPHQQGRYFRTDTVDGLLRSTDAGATWTSLGETAHRRSDLAFHPRLPGLLWYSDGSGQVLVSTDGAQSFETEFATPSSSNATGMDYDETDNALLVGTAGESAFEIRDVSPFAFLDGETAGGGGFTPRHYVDSGLPKIGGTVTLQADRMLGGAAALHLVGLSDPDVPLVGGKLRVGPPWILIQPLVLPGSGPGNGTYSLLGTLPNDPSLVDVDFFSQLLVDDVGVTYSNGLQVTIGM